MFDLSVEEKNFKLESIDFLIISYKFFFKKIKIDMKNYNLIKVKLKRQTKSKPCYFHLIGIHFLLFSIVD